MSRIRSSLSFRVRYEGRVQTFDRRPLKEAQADEARSSIRYMVARTLSPFRAVWKISASGKKAVRPKYLGGD